MTDHDNEAGVLVALRESLDDVGMRTPLEQIITAGQARQRRRRAGWSAGAAAGVAAAVGISFAAVPSAGPPAGGVHIRTVAYTVDRQRDGSVRVTWDKARYSSDSDGLQAALQAAGFPVLIKVGEFCRGPQDDGKLDPSGVGPGVERVMKGERAADGRVTFVFTPSAVPAGRQLFIGYLSAAQLAVTHGRPASVERLVPTDTALVCTTVAPPAH